MTEPSAQRVARRAVEGTGDYARKEVARSLKEIANIAKWAEGETDNLPHVAVRLAAILEAVNMVGYYIGSDNLSAAMGDLTKVAQKIRSATNNGKALE
jgi:hypothetical protein